ncbi:hypothetical protein BDR05DRAFT_998599 [Suillus weaverae]|nr:hypothetical protein BDR05DRAFT_998599 [Suillus weaverae]
MAHMLINSINIYGLQAQMTSDNVSDNDAAMKLLEHIHLAAQHFVDAVAPTPQAALMKKICQVLDKEDDADFDILNKELAAMEVNSDREQDDTFDTGDSLGKALTLIGQKACIKEKVPELKLLQWVRMCWASLYKSLDHMLLLWQAVNYFTNFADESKEVLNLCNKTYANSKLDQSNWKLLGLVHQVLKKPATVQQSFSFAKHLTCMTNNSGIGMPH